ncbi:type II toxin-antitoxin system RelE/ParE family toxin [Rhizobium sp. TRM95796]|uniref:type II toxin-antitoxin system RelE/ParE family toxin n=1 Tax=Rhizobium sp. TRM95796 TaxID=2979862 RepID=UPI0021E8866E|nr:type II toxin-antitoxin system RelE/ParE family toxin [Rhizobium sp. TRM95796]MCV3765502.1 type II toxin-antitoxin system RelE/ParE family toxin [Rhizobium sp. TRM95796]
MWQTIARHNNTAADRLYQRMMAKLQRASAYPLIGPARPKIAERARVMVEGNYIAIYEPTNTGILVVGIVDGRRDPETW